MRTSVQKIVFFFSKLSNRSAHAWLSPLVSAMNSSPARFVRRVFTRLQTGPRGLWHQTCRHWVRPVGSANCSSRLVSAGCQCVGPHKPLEWGLGDVNCVRTAALVSHYKVYSLDCVLKSSTLISCMRRENLHLSPFNFVTDYRKRDMPFEVPHHK